MVSAAFTAALALLVTGVGVDFGWQPLPGDATASELVVQVEPATLERLAEGAAIPLTADVPADAGRVARVRLVVVGGALPAPSLAVARREETRRKPIGEPSSIVLTQYNDPDSRYGAPAPNYGTAPGTAQPLASTPAPQTFDPYTQAPPTAPPASDWNSGANAVANSAPTGPLERIGAEIQTAAQPLQDGAQRVGEGVRQFGQNIAGRADQLRDSLGRPLQNGLLGGRAGATTTAATTGDLGGASQWNNAPTLPAVAPPTTPPLNFPAAAPANGVANGGGSSWNDNGPTTSGSNGVAPGTGGATSPAPPYAGGGVGASATNADRWTSADDPRLPGGAGFAAAPAQGGFGNAGGGGVGTNGNAGGGASNWGGNVGNSASLPEPPSLMTTTGGLGQNGPLLGSAAGGAGGASGTAPELRGWMLNQPGNRNLEGDATTPVATTSPALGGVATQPGSGNPAAVGNPGGGVNPGGSLLSSPSWTTGPQGAAHTSVATTTPGVVSPSAPPQGGAGQADGRQQAAVILAWVLLFASVAGNMYLFWSYLDVRTKYRALVRKTARAVGSRFSAA